ncbi:MAG: hypothetical protein HUK15_08830, partial [Bacteroidales bacterium]|nr:hypothetical protein [Bacteroidales bacterium]
MEKLHAHKEQLAELQKLYNEYKSAVSNKMSDEDIETYRIAFYSLCDNYDWMDYVVAEGDCEKLVNIKDEVIVPPIYERLDCCENMVNDKKTPVVAYKNGKCGLVLPDGKGTQVSDFDYDCIERADRFFIVGKRGKFGVLNAKGEVLVPCAMDKVEFHPIYLNNDSNQAWYDDCMFEIFQNGKVGVLTAAEVFV